MKKIKTIAALLAITSCFCICSYAETHYTRKAEVIKIADNLITAEDERGYLWDFEGDGFETGDKIKLIMDTNHTDSNIFDDKIIHVKEIKAQ